MKFIIMLLSTLFLSVACEGEVSPPRKEKPVRTRRVIMPPVGKVRAVAPHAIHSGGVGPYRLGISLRKILSLLPHRPRVELTKVGDLFDYDLVRTENNTLHIGVAPLGVSFVGVLGKKAARTAMGIGVGSTVEELNNNYSADAGKVIRDPRIWRSKELPTISFVLQKKTVEAVVIGDLLSAKDTSPAPKKGKRPRTAKRKCKAWPVEERGVEFQKAARMNAKIKSSSPMLPCPAKIASSSKAWTKV